MKRYLASVIMLCATWGVSVAQDAAAPIGSAGRPQVLTFTDPEKSVAVAVGQQFMLAQNANRTTGYEWQLAATPDPAVVKLVSAAYQQPEANRLGAGGTQVWTFEAVGRGTVAITLHYVRPWERDTPPARTASFTVVVH
jgi:inhibitor of cysteine peptidase